LALLKDVRAVLEEYSDYLPMTIRQTYYRLVGAYGYPKTELFYARLCEHLGNARRAQLIPFSSIRDDDVTVMEREHFLDLDDFWKSQAERARWYRRDKLARQAIHIEVWSEAAGMVPQLAQVANDYSIPVYSCSGFDSLTAKKDLADRVLARQKPSVILHLGDCDPSGEAVFCSVAEDVRAFVLADRLYVGVDVDFRRVALTKAQVEHYDLPTAPAKLSDSRTKNWDGETCQLEALPPDVIASLLQEKIRGLLDRDMLAIDELEEVRERRQLLALPPPSGR
jgi:hypothetical protein